MGTHRAECPAGAALALVLDIGDGALLAPVHLAGQRHSGGHQVRGRALHLSLTLQGL